MSQLNIVLAGNPNSGKTTTFNDLTGSNQSVGNWPGVTVEKKQGRLRNRPDVTVTDLPGIYSLSPYSPEEVVARNYLLDEHPDVVINVVDGTNLERNLFLTTQLIELGIPMVVALNFHDILEKRGDLIEIAKLSEELGVPVFETSATKGTGLTDVVERALAIAEESHANGGHAPSIEPRHRFSSEVEAAIQEVAAIIGGESESETGMHEARWLAIKLFEHDERVIKRLNLSPEDRARLEAAVSAFEDRLGDDTESVIAAERYAFISRVTSGAVRRGQVGTSLTDRIDRIVTNRWLSLPIFAVIMWAVYFISVSWLGTIVTDWTNDTLFGGWIMPSVSEFLASVNTAEWLTALVVDGILGGVGAVIGFVPQLIVLFTLLSILEDGGYMARIAFIMDRIFRRFGLSGKSFIPLMVASGCGVPGIMASRTIENDKDRRMTVMVTTFVPCSAKLPVIALIAGTFFQGQSWVAPSAYAIGIFAVLLSGIILKKTRLFAGDPAPFIMEMPPYRIPDPMNIVLHVWERVRGFLIKAGTVIFIAAGVIWFGSNFGFTDGGFGMVNMTESLFSDVGGFIAPVFAPLGFGTWQAATASIAGLLAKEIIVATMGVLYGIGEVSETSTELAGRLSTDFTVVSGYAFLVFNLLAAPCVAAIAAMRRELGWKWMWIGLGYMTALAYTFAFIINQLGSAIFLGAPIGIGTILAGAAVAVILYLLARPNPPAVKRLGQGDEPDTY